MLKFLTALYVIAWLIVDLPIGVAMILPAMIVLLIPKAWQNYCATTINGITNLVEPIWP